MVPTKLPDFRLYHEAWLWIFRWLSCFSFDCRSFLHSSQNNGSCTVMGAAVSDGPAFGLHDRLCFPWRWHNQARQCLIWRQSALPPQVPTALRSGGDPQTTVDWQLELTGALWPGDLFSWSEDQQHCGAWTVHSWRWRAQTVLRTSPTCLQQQRWKPG